MLIRDNGLYDQETFSNVTAADEIFVGVEFVGCHFEACRLGGCTFERCSFTECRFSRCDLSVVKIPGSKLLDVTFEDCKLIGINWTHTLPLSSHRAVAVSMSQCVVSYSSFYGMNLPGIEIVHSTVHEVDFGEANLRGGSLARSDLAGSIFLHTDMSRADFRGAHSYAIDLRANMATGARFSLPEAVSLLNGLDIVVE